MRATSPSAARIAASIPSSSRCSFHFNFRGLGESDVPRPLPRQRELRRGRRCNRRPFFEIIIVVADGVMKAAVVLKSQDRCANSVQEIPVVTDDNHVPLESRERFLQQSQRTKIEIVRWLIENQHVAAVLQNPRQQHAAAFTAAQLINLRIDPLLGEKKSAQVASQGDVLVAQPNEFALPRPPPPRLSLCRRAAGGFDRRS